jgi:hypothetical protein
VLVFLTNWFRIRFRRDSGQSRRSFPLSHGGIVGWSRRGRTWASRAAVRRPVGPLPEEGGAGVLDRLGVCQEEAQ